MYIFKRILKLFGFLALMCAVYISGAYLLPDYDSLKTPAPPPPAQRPPEPADPVYSELGAPAVIEYGYPIILSSNNAPFHAFIRYPEAGNPADVFIHDWVYDIYSNMAAHFSTGALLSPADYGEVNIQFDSYLIDNRYAGVHLFGEYSYNTAQYPQEIYKTFNIDLTQFDLMEPGQILDLENPEGILSLLRLRLLVEHPKTDGYLDFMDESWLSYLLITHEGIKVYLPYDEFLPDSFEALTVLLPYEDIWPSLLIRRDAPLPAMPTPSPEATTAPAATPAPSPAPEQDPDASTSPGSDDGESEDPDGTDPEEETPEPPPPPPMQSGSIDKDKPVIALSFDDGPGIYTDMLLNLLEEYGVRATFFAIGNTAHTRSESLMRAVNMGCEVAGQSWNHKNLAKMNEDDVRLQLETTLAVITEITGTECMIFRPPYGAVSETMKVVSEELGLSMVNWNLDSEDWKSKDAAQIYEAVMSHVSDRAIILSHDVYAATLEAYSRIIPELLIEGYQIVTVSELLKLTYNNLTPGRVYYSGLRVDFIE